MQSHPNLRTWQALAKAGGPQNSESKPNCIRQSQYLRVNFCKNQFSPQHLYSLLEFCFESCNRLPHSHPDVPDAFPHAPQRDTTVPSPQEDSPQSCTTAEQTAGKLGRGDQPLERMTGDKISLIIKLPGSHGFSPAPLCCQLGCRQAQGQSRNSDSPPQHIHQQFASFTASPLEFRARSLEEETKLLGVVL